MALFKYFTNEAYAQSFLNKGEMLMRPLSFFRVYEDKDVRGDSSEGILIYKPSTGLEITKQDGTTLTLKGWQFTSSAAHQDIFVYCASKNLSKELAERFESPFCVEVYDLQELLSRLKGRASRASKLDYEGLLHGSVEYRENDRPPGADWALPEKLTFIKPPKFSWQDEYRIAIGRRGAFDVENVTVRLESEPNVRGETPFNHIILRIGSIVNFARIHYL